MKNAYDMSIKDSYRRLGSYNLNLTKSLENFGRKRILAAKTTSQYYRQMRLLSVLSTLEFRVLQHKFEFSCFGGTTNCENMQDKRITQCPWTTRIVFSYLMGLRD